MKSFTASVARDGDTVSVLAPHTGFFVTSVRPGDLVTTGTHVGDLLVVGVKCPVFCPEMAPARVTAAPSSTRRGVAWHGILLEARELSQGVEQGGSTPGETAQDEFESFKAPMEGQFYRSSSPDVPAFFLEGDVVKPGDTIGLIEVMKFFYPIVFQGREPMRIVRFDAADARPIEAGAVIVWLKAVEAP
jgi:acetyl-CoA carboxylase biotin carboxyl carrier protein